MACGGLKPQMSVRLHETLLPGKDSNRGEVRIHVVAKPGRGSLERLSNAGQRTSSWRANLPPLRFFPSPQKVSGRERLLPDHTPG
jgi:hypothetical protein